MPSDDCQELALTDVWLKVTLWGGAGDDTLRGGGGNDVLMNASYLIASCVRHSGATGQLDCENWVFRVEKKCLRWRLDRSNIKTAPDRSMRLAGHKWLGRRMDVAWGNSDIQTNLKKPEVQQ